MTAPIRHRSGLARAVPFLPARQRELFSLVYTTPGLHLSELARRLKLHLSTVNKALLRLERLGLVVCRREFRPATSRRPAANLRLAYPAAWTLA